MIDTSRLLPTLQQTGLAHKNQPLYQLLNQLIGIETKIAAIINATGGIGPVGPVGADGKQGIPGNLLTLEEDIIRFPLLLPTFWQSCISGIYYDGNTNRVGLGAPAPSNDATLYIKNTAPGITLINTQMIVGSRYYGTFISEGTGFWEFNKADDDSGLNVQTLAYFNFYGTGGLPVFATVGRIQTSEGFDSLGGLPLVSKWSGATVGYKYWALVQDATTLGFARAADDGTGIGSVFLYFVRGAGGTTMDSIKITIGCAISGRLGLQTNGTVPSATDHALQIDAANPNPSIVFSNSMVDKAWIGLATTNAGLAGPTKSGDLVFRTDDGTNGNFYFAPQSGGVTALAILRDAKVGVNVQVPVAQFEVDIADVCTAIKVVYTAASNQHGLHISQSHAGGGGGTTQALIQVDNSGSNPYFNFDGKLFFDNSGKLGIGQTTITALLHLKAGTATANTAPIKLTSGTLLTTPEAGAIEFLTDAYYGTITTGAARKTFAFKEDVAVTQGSGKSDAQNAAVASVATFTVGSSNALFLVGANINVTTATLHNFTCTVSYTDETNTARVLTLNFSQLTGAFVTAITNATGAGAYEGIPLTIRAKASTSITIATTGTFTTVTYNVAGFINQVALT